MEGRKLFHKDFLLVVIGQIISLFGNGIVRFALPLYLLNQTGSATIFGLVTALSFVPMIVIMPIGGIIADRVNKRNVMVVLDFMTAALMLAIYLMLGRVDLVALLVVALMVLFGIQGVYQPTVQASMPLLQDKERLLTGNAIINQVGALANLIAPIIGGILFGVWGLIPIVVVGGVCFLSSAIMELFINIPHTKATEKMGVLKIVRQDFSDSFSFMSKDKPVILKSTGIICAFNLFLSAMLTVALPVILTQYLGMSDELYGFSLGALAAGSLAGGVLVGVLAKRLSMNRIYLLLLICAGLLLPVGAALWLGLPPFISYLVISISCFCLMGVATMVTVQMLTFIQGETPAQLIGKVVSYVMALAMCSQPLGQAMYGFLFDSFKAEPHTVVLGAAVVSGVIAVLSRRVFREYQL